MSNSDVSNTPEMPITSATDPSISSTRKRKNKSKAASLMIGGVKQIKGLPDDEAIANKTDADVPDPDYAGEYTEGLSDFTQADDGLQSKRTNAFTSWYHHVQPLITNRRVKFYAVVNFILFLINFILLLALIVVIIYAIVLGVQAQNKSKQDKPCLYDWDAWSKCSKACRESNNTDIPMRYRKVNKTSIVHARGKYAKSAPCPEDVQNLVDYAPCNTHFCEKNLSQFEFTQASFRRNASDGSDCYQIRDIPRSDMLIHVDTIELTKGAKCGNSSSQQT